VQKPYLLPALVLSYLLRFGEGVSLAAAASSVARRARFLTHQTPVPPKVKPNMNCRTVLRILATTVLVIQTAIAEQPPTPTAEQEQFFESKIRPLLADHCWDCHGADVQESGFRMDSRNNILAGGNSGKAISVPGNPDGSYLMQVVRHEVKVTMPPDDKLADEQLAALATWIEWGMPWPSSSMTNAAPLTKEQRYEMARREHWAFQPLVEPELPVVQASQWVNTPIDRFVMSELEAANLHPSPPAGRRTIIRRLYFDLLGLPPTYEAIQEFEEDTSPDAYERLVNRLLSSAHYGERWGRHWLDVARYADTRGYAFTSERRYPYAYTYRDYVIDAFNEDLPYDRFVLEQLAADLLPLDAHDQSLAALGFLTVGRKFNNRHDDLDDQIDVVGRGLLGLSVACARCHDHKYDPIPTEDYYSLYGVMASSSEPKELPTIGDPHATPGYEEFKQELDRLKANVEDYKKQKRDEFVDITRKHSTDYLVRALSKKPEKEVQELPFIVLKGEEVKRMLVQRWRQYLITNAKPEHPVWGPLSLLALLPDEQFDKRSTEIVAKLSEVPEGLESNQLNPLVRQALEQSPPQSKTDLARLYGELFSTAYTAWQESRTTASETKLSAETDQIAQILLGPGSPADISIDEVSGLLNRAEANKFRELQKKVDSHQVNAAGAPPRAMVLSEGNPFNPRVFIRGNPARAGKEVPRRFLIALSGVERQPFEKGSGRLEMAQRIVDPENPLTARVIVNRVWMHHFGQPLVDTPSDFGVRCEAPVHRAMLDYLACSLRRNDWSLKALHREILLSSTFRQSSQQQAECVEVDPENRLFWRANRRRLELEAMRDAMVAVTGRLDATMGGRPVNLTTSPYALRRAVYGFIDRQDLPGMFRIFDFANPDQSSPKRPRTTVPQQALFLMNSAFAIEQAKAIASLPDVAAAKDDRQRINLMYKAVLARLPSQEEMAIGEQFVASVDSDQQKEIKLNPWEQYAQVLLLTNEFMFVD
jgi:mono/diheme cytochrome c family protein